MLDADGCACSATCTNGEGSGVVVPGTGLHLNNVMGEEDLNPLGFHRHRPRQRMPSMMAPTVVMREGEVELVLGSAGSNRIRSALLQTIIGVVDHGLGAAAAVGAPRVHFENGVLFAEPGIDLEGLPAELQVVRFGSRNLFFGGVQAVLRRGGELEGAGDPRRGGVAVAGLMAAGPRAVRGGAGEAGRRGGRRLAGARLGLLVRLRGGAPADVFIVTRTGSTPHAHLTLLVDEEGNVHCNGRAAPGKLSDSELVRAEGIREDLQNLASRHATLAAAAGLGDELPPARRKRQRALRRQLRRASRRSCTNWRCSC